MYVSQSQSQPVALAGAAGQLQHLESKFIILVVWRGQGSGSGKFQQLNCHGVQCTRSFFCFFGWGTGTTRTHLAPRLWLYNSPIRSTTFTPNARAHEHAKKKA